jgi:hypothetical protein
MIGTIEERSNLKLLLGARGAAWAADWYVCVCFVCTPSSAEACGDPQFAPLRSMRRSEQLALCQQWDSVAARTKVLKDTRESAECINDSTLLHTQSRAIASVPTSTWSRHISCGVMCRIREGSTTIVGTTSTRSMPNHGSWLHGVALA